MNTQLIEQAIEALERASESLDSFVTDHRSVLKDSDNLAVVASTLTSLRAARDAQPVELTDEELAKVLTEAYGSPDWTLADARAARAVLAAQRAKGEMK